MRCCTLFSCQNYENLTPDERQAKIKECQQIADSWGATLFSMACVSLIAVGGFVLKAALEDNMNYGFLAIGSLVLSLGCICTGIFCKINGPMENDDRYQPAGYQPAP